MKQHITKEQWEELSDKQKEKFCNWELESKTIGKTSESKYPNIGQMIYFLGDDWFNYMLNKEGRGYFNFNCWALCDALWNGVKEKLRNK